MMMKTVKVLFTKHAIRRIWERGCNFQQVISCLDVSHGECITKNGKGYEIVIPMKGRLVGDFNNGQFIVKSFFHPTFKHRNNAKKISAQKYIILLSPFNQQGVGTI